MKSEFELINKIEIYLREIFHLKYFLYYSTFSFFNLRKWKNLEEYNFFVYETNFSPSSFSHLDKF